MIIAIDCRMWGKTYGGIGRYVREIVLNMVKEQNWSFVLIVSEETVKKEVEAVRKDGQRDVLYKVCRAKMFSLAEQTQLPRVVPECDIFWSPYMNVPFMPVKAKHRVVTLHDVFHLANPQYYSRMKRLMIKPFYHFSTRKSDMILTVSEFSKNEIVRCCGSRFADKIKAVYNGCEIDVEKVAPANKGFRYILFVGSIKPHKNLRNALLGFQEMNEPGLRFVIVGKREGFITGDTEVFELVSKLNEKEEKVIFTGNINDEELYQWYASATALVQPSFYEGFGLPVVEAMHFGLPIGCSDIPVFKEIGKDWVSYFDPYSPSSIADCLTKVVKMERKDYPKWMPWKETSRQIAYEFEKMVSMEGHRSI